MRPKKPLRIINVYQDSVGYRMRVDVEHPPTDYEARRFMALATLVGHEIYRGDTHMASLKPTELTSFFNCGKW